MKAIVLEKPGRFVVSEIPEPPEPGPGEALVRVQRVGICGSDYSGYLGKMPFYSYPRIPGHELGVEIIAVGQGVSEVRPGDRCSVEPYLNCQRCAACDRGHGNCCENLQVLGVHTDGGLRPRFIVPARKLHRSDRLSFDQLALVETLAIGCHAVNRGHPQSGDNLLVIGAGPIGLSTITFARLSGARTMVMDLDARRLEFCREKMGVEDTILFRGDGSEMERLRKMTDGVLPRVVIDATGSHQSMSEALHYVAFTGRLVYVGLTTVDLKFSHALMHRRELTLLASRNALPEEFPRIIQLIEDGQIDTRPWLTHHARFEEMSGVFDRWLDSESGVIKALVEVT